ncbi:MAG: chloride channel protein [Ktedonobacterales bacterium]
MTDASKSVPGAGSPPTTGSPAQAPQSTRPKIWQIILIALVAIVFTALFLGIYDVLSKTIWSNSFVTAHRWTIPVGAVLFSLLVGLTRKYLRAPTVIHGTTMESLKGSSAEQVDYSVFPGALLSSLCSLLSGASVGPEGPIGFLVQEIAAWIHQRLKLAQNHWQGFESAAFASAYNGVIGSPLFTGVLATEYKVGGNSGLVYLAWNLLAGVIGYLFYTLLGLHTFAQYIAFTPISTITLTYAVYAILLALVGGLVAIFVGLMFQVIGQAMDRVFHDAVVLRALAAGLVIGIVCYFLPEVMFAGESQIFPMLHNPASYGVLALFGLGILKLLLLALSFKSGYLGGPTFPILFACTMFGLALSLLFPTVPVSIFVLCIEVSALTLAAGAPLTMILLVAVIGTADAFTITLLTLSAAVAMLVGEGLKRLRAQRAAQRAAAHPQAGPATA